MLELFSYATRDHYAYGNYEHRQANSLVTSHLDCNNAMGEHWNSSASIATLFEVHSDFDGEHPCYLDADFLLDSGRAEPPVCLTTQWLTFHS